MTVPHLLGGIVTAYGLGLLSWLLWPAFRESLVGQFVAIPMFSIYIVEHLGVPGLTDRTNCDWMWCRPTGLGVVVVGAVWCVAAGVARLQRPSCP